MKKSLFAIAAVTAFAGAAQAQSSVTVYGILDQGYKGTQTQTTTTGVTTTTSSSGFSGAGSATSRIGFRGVEDIGGGRSVTFNLEYGITPGTGATATDNVVATGTTAGGTGGIRTSTVGFTDKAFGTVTAGRQLVGITQVTFGTIFAASGTTGDIMHSPNGQTGAGTNPRIHVLMERASNSVKYVTPNFSGFTATLDYSGDRSKGATPAADGLKKGDLGISAAYVNGPFTVRAGTHTVKIAPTSVAAAIVSTTTGAAAITAVNAGAEVSTTINAASARYSAKGLTVEAIYAANKSTSLGLQTGAVSAAQLGVQYAFGNIVPFAKYGMGKTETGASGASNRDTKGMQLGVQYSLSKRSTLYAVYGQSDNKVASSTTANTVGNKVSTKDIVAGLRHTF